MKNAMKKLMSLVLVAIMLVSALPFAAFADGANTLIRPKVDGVETDPDYTIAGDAAVSSLLITAYGDNWEDTYNFVTCWRKNDEVKYNATTDIIPAGSEVVLAVTTKTTVCPSCGVTYKVTETHDCVPPVTDVTCDKCGTVYQSNVVHTCPVLTCTTCGQSYTQVIGQTHTCPAPIKIVVKVDSSDNKVWEGTKIPANGEYATVGNLLTHCWSKTWSDTYNFKHAYAYRADGSKGYVETLDGKINAGEEVHILVTKKSVDFVPGTGTTPTNKFKWDIYLNIYTNNKVDAPAKTIKINDTIALDHKVTLAEALTIVDDYYYATNSTKGIQLDGLYKGMGNWALQFVTDSGKADAFTNLDSAREENYVFINVMATNVTARGTATADTSNPKTGDAIFAPIMVLGLSASALAVMFYLNKKRAF